MTTASFKFHGDLNDFLPAARKNSRFVYRFDEYAAVKDTLEAIGVPHVEIDVIVADRVSIGFADRISDGAHVSVYPRHIRPHIAHGLHLLPPPLPVCRFVLDVHLGLLARRLRMLGFDTLYRNDYTDHQIVAISVADNRIALTRDTGLLKHAALRRGRWVRSSRPATQITEIVRVFALREQARPFTRCIRCNAAVELVGREEVAGNVPARVLRAHERFRLCRCCGRVYWSGSHYDRMRAMVHALIESPSADR